MTDKLTTIAEQKPKLKIFLDILLRIVVQGETGRIEVNFSEGGVTSASFTKREI
jgi:hypothetical protein